MSSTGIIIQARMGSTRLPKKVLMPAISGKSILDIQTSLLKSTFPCYPLIIATSTAKADDAIANYATENNIHCYRGSENDVLARFRNAAKEHELQEVYRVCADNPFLDMQLMQDMDIVDKANVDYLSYQDAQERPAMQTHFGFFAEWIRVSALDTIIANTDEPLYREHVTNYIYQRPDLFNIEWMTMPDIISHRSDIRLTVDTEKDMNFASELYTQIENIEDKIRGIVNWIDSNPEIKKAMSAQVSLNTK